MNHLLSGLFRAVPLAASSPRLWLSSGMLLLGCLWLMPNGDFRQPEAFVPFSVGMSMMSAGYVLSWGLRWVPTYWFWGIALLTRLLLLPMYPGDDVWRYLWEGYIQTLGFSPYHFAPDAIELVSYRTEWWSQINHLDVSAIYPPIAQLSFRVLAAIKPTVFIFKLAFVFADLSICWLLSRRLGDRSALLYAWNPLILYSFAGAAHYDSWFIFPLVAAWFSFDGLNASSRSPHQNVIDENSSNQDSPNQDPAPSNQPLLWSQTALLVGISVAIKWMSLPILVFLSWQAWKQTRLKQVGWVMLWGGMPLILSVLPFCQDTTCPLIPTESVFVSHGRSAELIPYLTGLLWQSSKQTNWIYAIPLGATVLWLLWRSKSFLNFTTNYLLALLMLSPIIHAWYFTWIIPFAAATNNLGVRLVSISALIYFLLPHRAAMGDPDWFLSPTERLVLWLPLILGWVWSSVQR
ncbi:hypothetical protein [Egbenema bharatensis]|uniref:hypothetical protein n=1 Tax=Egbenema bharatensis TaxID=3463334 RepID=UPI003A838806